jgi:hypothetical protein
VYFSTRPFSSLPVLYTVPAVGFFYQEVKVMIVTAWKNGTPRKSGAGYGVKLDVEDRDRFFRREWRSIRLSLDGTSVVVDVNIAKPSFWGETCRELISAEIGRWLIRNGLVPWIKGTPPKLVLEHIEGNRFLLRKIT